jgi:hypothetical protein
MVYQGYLSLGGTEIINQARTVAYVHHALPRLDLRGCDECDDFHEVVGDAPYQSPLIDQPDWWDANNVDSWDFYGLYPLAMDGFDDGTTQATVTELMGPGAAISLPRRASRQLRITGLLVGRTDAAISYGMVWLRNALLGNPCGDALACTGDHLCYFTACPPVCSDSPDWPDAGAMEIARIRSCEDGVILDPLSECTAPYERILYDVTLVDAPRIVERYASECGQYVRVEFTLVAGTPSPVGVARRAVGPDSITRPPVLIPEIRCDDDGGITERLNLMPSPRMPFEEGVWQYLWGGQVGTPQYTIDPDVSPPPQSDMPSLREVVQLDLGQMRMSQLDDLGALRTVQGEGPFIPGSPETDVVASVYVRASRDVRTSLWFDYLDSDFNSLGQTPVGTLPLTANTWGRVTVTFNAPEGTRFLVGHGAADVAEGTAVPGDTTWWGAAMLEYGSTPRVYFDGDTEDTETVRYAWRSTRYQSTSEAQRVVQDSLIVVDPDCSPIPDPPRAPSIEDSCIDEASQWRRYQYVLEPDLVPVWSDALPVVQLAAEGTAVRQVRIRFYPNPLGADTGDLEPCSYCGEFIVAYIPPWSTMTVDAIRQTAFVTSPGGVVRAATHLLYASDGGPIEWTSLSCGLEYTMTVDVLPTAITGLQTTMCLAARE